MQVDTPLQQYKESKSELLGGEEKIAATYTVCNVVLCFGRGSKKKDVTFRKKLEEDVIYWMTLLSQDRSH